MTKHSVTDVLRALATSDQNRTATARLRDILPEVEAAIEAGVRREAILAALNADGFSMTINSFESALYRLRKKERQLAEMGLTRSPMQPRGAVAKATGGAGPEVDTSRESLAERLEPQKIKTFEHKAIPKKDELF